ncbi:MAG: NADH-quinone oxidoreductase subunit NuoE [candidate division WOR-3 bacterium]|nr:MAG: NADH-quinone oxidoreductase subunit NuoE [candidate division WOR-3 bacterium]
MKINIKNASTIIDKYRGKKSALLAVLQDIQEEYNWLPPEVLTMVSEKLCVPMIDVYGVATFYRAFSLTPRGKHLVTVCLGTACHVRGAPLVLDRVQEQLGISPGCTTKDNQFTLESVNCLGACALAPIVVIDGNYHGQTTTKKVDAMLAKYKKKRKPTRKSKKKK